MFVVLMYMHPDKSRLFNKLVLKTGCKIVLKNAVTVHKYTIKLGNTFRREFL